MLLVAAKPQRKKARRVESTFLGKSAEPEKRVCGCVIKMKTKLSAYGTQNFCRLIEICVFTGMRV